jgi:hypothetical protein
MFPVRRIESSEDAGLNVFVPGLMAAGILLSIVMLAADATKALLPSRGQRARHARIARRLRGRVNDLESIALGVAPHPFKVEREPRGVIASIAVALASLAATYAIVAATVGAYSARTGSLSHRGWTLSGGFGLASLCAAVGVLALINVFLREGRRPLWLEQASRHWLLGRLPRTREFEEV